MIVRKVLIVLFVISCTIACSPEMEQEIIIYDDYLKKQLISELQNESISFSVIGENIISYSQKDSSRVKEIYDEAIRALPIRYSFFSEEQALELIAFLELKNIEYYASETNNKHNIWVDKKYKLELQHFLNLDLTNR